MENLDRHFAGTFEVHLTVEMNSSMDLDRLKNWAKEHDFKFTHIVLDRGDNPSQPMLTGQTYGTLEGLLIRSEKWIEECRQLGIVSRRLKLEVSPFNGDVPKSQADAEAFGQTRYFEHHVKLELPPEFDLSELERLIEPHEARLSRNAFRVRADGVMERFVTQRCHSAGVDVAQQKFKELQDALSDGPWTILEAEEEYVVFDSNYSLDAGWLRQDH